VDVYLSFYAWIGDSFSPVRVKNYLQVGQTKQADRGAAALSALTAALVKKYNLTGGLPPVFTVDGYPVITNSLTRVSIGKAAPDEIQLALWLPGECGLVTDATRYAYCDANLGTDCGGFVACFWGIGHPTTSKPSPYGSDGIKPRSFFADRPNRRHAASEIRVGDAAIFMQDVKNDDPDVMAVKDANDKYDTSTGSQAFHIGLVASVSVSGDQVTMGIAESSGAPATSGGNGVNVRSLGTVKATVSRNLVWVPDGKNRIYFVGPQTTPSPYLPNTYGA
jgi:hypothetical protein